MARIFIVEDEPDIRALLAGSLIEEGHEVSAAGDGEMALEELMADPPDVLVLDLMLPGIDGLTILKEMKTCGLTAKTKVVVLSARCSDEDRQAGYDLGADRYISKPFDPDELKRVVVGVLEKEVPQTGAPGTVSDRSYRLAQLDELR